MTRFKGSPGANDNAAAIFQLLAYWEEMHHRQQGNRAQILFTDKEGTSTGYEALRTRFLSPGQ